MTTIQKVETAEDLFKINNSLTLQSKIRLAIFGLVLAPLRLFVLMVIVSFIYVTSRLGLLFTNPETRDLKPHTGWRKIVQRLLSINMGYLAFFLLGFRVKIQGEQSSREEAPILIAAPHTSFLDCLTIARCEASPVVRKENRSIPVIWAVLAICHAIYVNKKTTETRRQVSEEIIKRSTSTLAWPQVLIFPEGTTSNGKALARFNTGGFQPGVPVQPITISYSHPDMSVWTRRHDQEFKLPLLDVLCNPTHTVTIEFLPVYRPSQAEKENPILFANNVQRIMAKSLDIPATDFTRSSKRKIMKSNLSV